MRTYPESTQDRTRLSDQPSGFLFGIASGALVLIAVLTAAFTDHGSLQRLLVMAIAAAIAVGLLPDWRHGLLLALVGYLLYVGFLVNQEGELSWHGRDAWDELLTFGLSVWIGLAYRRIRVKRPSRVAGRS